MFDSPKFIMANAPDLLEQIVMAVISHGTFGYFQLKSLVSSPRLAEYWIQDLNTDGLVDEQIAMLVYCSWLHSPIVSLY
ncbi:hypothetical protein [Pseudomonas sp. PWP3-1b2]|uniref:hypothetical protein n=1 Tax=Pseudomonas sp. PWP3-1b2 TaxID=2804656 RepID=UPI003CED40AA